MIAGLILGVVALQPGLKPVLYQPFNVQFVRFWDSGTSSAIFAGDSVNNALRVNCITGCSGGAGGGLTDAQLRATPVPMSISSSVNLTLTNSFLLDATFTGRINTLGQKVMASSTPVVIASDQSALTVGTHAVTGSGNFTVVQGTGTNLHAVLDSGSTTTVTQGTGTNLHAVIDSGTITTVTTLTGITNALPAGNNNIGDVDIASIAAGNNNIGDVDVASIAAGTNRIGSVRLVDSADADLTSAKGTQTSRFVGVQDSINAGRTTRMFTANIASSATTETLITLTFSNNLAATSTCSSCAITSGKKIRFQAIAACARISTGTNAHTVTLNLRGAVGGATTTASPLQMTMVQTLAASSTNCSPFSPLNVPDDVEYDANAGTNTFGITITDPGFSAAAQVVTFVLTIAAFEY